MFIGMNVFTIPIYLFYVFLDINGYFDSFFFLPYENILYHFFSICKEKNAYFHLSVLFSKD